MDSIKKPIEYKPEGSPNLTDSNLKSELKKVVKTIKQLEVLSDPKEKRNRSLADILSLSNSVSTKTLKMIEKIIAKL